MIYCMIGLILIVMPIQTCVLILAFHRVWYVCNSLAIFEAILLYNKCGIIQTGAKYLQTLTIYNQN